MDENVDEIWENDEWTFQARQIINNIGKFSENSKLILILRHSHREDSRDVKEMIDMGLTPLGRKIARKFGELLPKNRPVRLYYSLSSRCKETAKEILIGFQDINGKGELMGPLKPLYDVGGTGKFITSQMFQHSGHRFIIRWATGLYSEEQITPFKEYCKQAADIIWNQIDSLESNGIDVQITHDLHLVALRMGWFDVPPEMN